MKRLIYLFSLLSLLLLSACTKSNDTLVGTSWSGAETGRNGYKPSCSVPFHSGVEQTEQLNN